MTGDLANEWSDYTYKLKNTGLSLNRCKDSLFWSKNVKTGTISAALAYKSSVPSTFSECIPLWFKEVWRWNIPLKTVLFSWLMLAERILTWNMLQKKGFAGPGICPLCHDAEESITHLMIKCSFSVQVWQHIGHFFETELLWHGLNITEAFRNWITGGDELRTIPFHVCRFIWLARNSIIFRDVYSTPHQIVDKVQYIWNVGSKRPKVLKQRIIQQPTFQYDLSIGYFDWASQEGGTKCGAGAILIAPHLGRYNIKWNCGYGTNTWSELLALWSILHFARSMGIESIQLAGDSRVIVEWFKGIFHLESVHLTFWMDRILQLKRQFSVISIQHVYREINHGADLLSKQALEGPVGNFLVAHGDGQDPSSYTIFGTF